MSKIAERLSCPGAKKTKDIRLAKPEMSSVAEHSIETGHGVDFSGKPLLDRK